MKKILLTAESCFLTDLYREKFHEQGFEVAIVTKDGEVIRELENNRPDVILIDPLLPGIECVEMIRFIRSREFLRHLPVILLSDLSHSSGTVQSAWQAGASRFLNKSDTSPTTVFREVCSVLEAAEHIPRKQIFRELPGFQPIKVLLADDDPTIHSILEFHLTQAGFEMSSVFDGTDALAAAEVEVPDLLVLDVMMPGLDGFKVLEKWRSHKNLCKIPVIMLTVWGDNEDMVTTLQNGADAYLTKPLRPSVLLNKVRDLTSPLQSMNPSNH